MTITQSSPVTTAEPGAQAHPGVRPQRAVGVVVEPIRHDHRPGPAGLDQRPVDPQVGAARAPHHVAAVQAREDRAQAGKVAFAAGERLPEPGVLVQPAFPAGDARVIGAPQAGRSTSERRLRTGEPVERKRVP